MGDGKINCEPRPHWQEDSGIIGVRFWLHKGAISYEFTSGEAAASYYTPLKYSATVSQVAFNGVAVDAWGDDYGDLAVDFKAAVRGAFAAI